MSNYIVFHKPFTPLIDRFKALLKDRDAEMRLVLAKADVPPPRPKEILRIYGLVLSELTFNSVSLINQLTTIADQHDREQAEAIAEAICARIIEAPVDQKLPSLYLLDNIVKKIGREYATYFSTCLPEVFCEAYKQVTPNLHPLMRHLFDTWSSVFPYSVLRIIEDELQLYPLQKSQRSSGSPLPSHGIHVNPRFLEARHQFENLTADDNSQYARESPPSSSFQFDDVRPPSPIINELRSDHSPVRFDDVDRNMTWQHTEEEEFNWEEINPTLPDSTANSTNRPVNDSSTRSNNGFIDDLANETKQFPNHPVLQETWNPISQPQSFQHPYNSNESQPNYQMPVAPMLSSQNAEAQFRPSISSSTTNSNHNSFIHQERNFDHINTNQSQNNPFFPSHSQFIHPNSAPPYNSGPPPNFGHNPQFTYVNTVMPNHVMSNQNSNPNPVYPNPPAGGGVVSNLISSLVAHGLISLGQPVSTQDSLEFNQDLQKVRHESAVTALYADLPRQCTTCGLRFKSREEHSNHMDWHVIKNRFSKKPNHKKPSRQWYVSVSTWLSGSESSANPQFLQPTDESVTDTKDDDEELAVPADEDQTTCALCGESFDDFYSDVADEWMYRDAVYMYAPPGKVAADVANKSRLGPIVHAKCRPESRKRGSTEEDSSKQKRPRS